MPKTRKPTSLRSSTSRRSAIGKKRIEYLRKKSNSTAEVHPHTPTLQDNKVEEAEELPYLIGLIQSKDFSGRMYTICRTCLSEEQDMKSVFDTDSSLGDTLQLFEMLMACTSVQVEEDDGLPAQICLSCINHVARSFTFKKLCEDSDNALREVLRKSTALDTELKPSLDVQLCAQETLVADIDPNVLDIKMEFEEGETNVGDLLVSSSELMDCKEDDIKIIKNGDDLQSQTIESADNQDRKPDIKENPMPDESEQPMYSCKECIACFTVENDLKIHSRTHRKLTKRKCTVNRQKLASATTLQSDRKPPSDANVTHTCPQCGKSFKYRATLKRHLTIHTGTKPCVCILCDKRYATSYALREHMRAHANVRNMICAECGQSFVRRSHLNFHLRTHTDMKTCPCSVCGKQMCGSYAMTKHMTTHAGLKDHVCCYCGKGFTTSSSLTIHERKHTGEKPYVCKVCNEGFASTSDLTIHARAHSGEKPHVCDVCGKGYVIASQLKNHKHSHTDEKTYQCHLCPRTFKRSESLKLHIQKHSGKPKHVCVHCNKGFYKPYRLAEHMRMHTGERPYKCEFCHKTFTLSASLYCHLKRTCKTR